jgi:prepilin-type N-terminal cleavage/methylation domain-containing protein
MTESAPPPRDRGFTLLEIMIALAILAVGSICVLSTFAAAIALHMKREANVRGARVMEEARFEAQQAWDAWRPVRGRPLPPALEGLVYSRDRSVSYSISFQPAQGQPKGLDDSTAGVLAVVRVRREGDDPQKSTTMSFFLTRTGFRPEDMKGSMTFEKEREADKARKYDAGGKKNP